MRQIAKAIGIDPSGCLKVRSVEPEIEFKPGGSMWGRCYEWGVNKYTFTHDKAAVMQSLGLTEEEYEHWLPLITF